MGKILITITSVDTGETYTLGMCFFICNFMWFIVPLSLSQWGLHGAFLWGIFFQTKFRWVRTFKFKSIKNLTHNVLIHPKN